MTYELLTHQSVLDGPCGQPIERSHLGSPAAYPGSLCWTNCPSLFAIRLKGWGNGAAIPAGWSLPYWLCAQRPWLLRELAILLERNPVYLQHRYLTPLVRKGLLQRKFPDEPNRPDWFPVDRVF